jgi:hypothetical protein
MMPDRTLYTRGELADDTGPDASPETGQTAPVGASRASQGLPERPVSYIALEDAAKLVSELSREVRNQLCMLSRILLLTDRKITAQNIFKLWPERATMFEFGFSFDAEQRVPAPDIKAIEAYLATEDYLDKMAKLGISFAEADDGLSSKQIAFLGILTDITSTTSLSAGMRRVGVSWVELQAWQLNPEFKQAWEKLGNGAIKTSIPLAEMQIARKMANGDQKAIEFGFALTGHYDPARNKQLDAKKLFSTLLEIIEDEVKDPATLARIGQRLQLSGNKALEP